MITMKTADLLGRRAAEANAIANAIYEAGFQHESDELVHAAKLLAEISGSLRNKLERYAASALQDEGDPTHFRPLPTPGEPDER